MKNTLTHQQVEAFWKRTVPLDNGCIEWTRGKTGKGYGSLKVNGKMVYAHRVSYMITHGEIDDSLQCCHSCDNPACVNPDHLWTGSNADNAADMKAKGRSASGERQHLSRLTRDDVLQIRTLFSQGKSQASMSRMYGVSDTCIYDVVTGNTWKNI